MHTLRSRDKSCCASCIAVIVVRDHHSYIGAKIHSMTTGGGLVLLEPLHDKGARSWFKRFEVCSAANLIV